MVDKKVSTKKVDKKPNEKKETRAEAFLRIGTRRVKQLLNSIRLLGNTSSKSNYEYTENQVSEISESVYTSLQNMFAKFTPSTSEAEAFQFSK